MTTDFIESFSQSTRRHSLQKLHVLLLAHRDSAIQWFIPAPRFSLPTRGNIYNIELSNTPANTSVCISDCSLLELSGVNPMEISMDLPSPCASAAKKRRTYHSFQEAFDMDDLVWYQTPVTFHGIK